MDLYTIYITVDQEGRIIFKSFDPTYQPTEEDILIRDYEIPEEWEGYRCEQYYKDGKIETVYEPIPPSLEDQLIAQQEINVQQQKIIDALTGGGMFESD